MNYETSYLNAASPVSAPRCRTALPGVGIRAALAVIISAILVAGCANGSSVPLSKGAGLSCVDDSSHCIKQRQYALNSFLSDTTNSWVHQPVSAEAYASGVRLFAYKKKKKQLSCKDLRRGPAEAQNARTVLGGPAGKKLSPAQVARGAMLGTEVARELKREIRRRCGRT